MLMLTSAFFITAANSLNETTLGRQKSNHPMSIAWSLQPLIGIYGTLLNSFVLYMGYVERQTFIRPVNAMIWCVPVHFIFVKRLGLGMGMGNGNGKVPVPPVPGDDRII